MAIPAIPKFSEWHSAVKAGVGVMGTIGAIIGSYIAVEAWAEDKISETERKVITEMIEQQVRNEIDHDKIVQSQRLDFAQTNLNLIELQMEHLEEEIAEREEDGQEPTERQKRKMNRLVRQLEVYEAVEEEATTKLTIITRTTTTTTETTTDE